MTRTNFLSATAAITTLCLIGLSSYSPLYAMWGLNHLHYLNMGWTYAAILVAVIVLVVAMVPFRSSFAHRVVERMSVLLWERGPWFKLLAAVSAGFVFYSFRLKLFFIGDGYHLLNTFGGLSNYRTGVTKLGAVELIRFTQYLLGNVSYESAITAFQIVSIASGIVVVYNLIGIAEEMAAGASKRLFCLVTLLFSGAMLLFFGHVEFYAIVWAVVTMFIKTSLRFINHRVRLWPALVFFVLALIVHIQAACFFPAILYLVWLRIKKNERGNFPIGWLKAVAIAIPVLCLIGGAVAVFAFPDLRSFFLPLLNTESSWGDYGTLSLQSVLELVNLVFLVTPGILLLCVVLIKGKSEPPDREIMPFFALAAACTTGFLLVVNPSLGMGRDFDLMSLMILPVILLLLDKIPDKQPDFLLRPLILILIVSTFAMSTFLVSNISVASSEKRTHDLLSLYGSRDRGGWVSYTGYLQIENRIKQYRLAMQEMDIYFPGQARLREIDSLLDAGRRQEAEILVGKLVLSNPRNGLFLRKQGKVKALLGDHEGALAVFKRAAILRPDHVSFQLLGLECLRTGRAAEAVTALERAHKLAPMDPEIIEGLASSLLYVDQIPRALSLADTLFQFVPGSPGGHVIYMIGAVYKNDLQKARIHYRTFLQTGNNRPDYNQIVGSYKFLIDSVGM